MDLDLVLFDMDGLVFDSETVYFEANQIAAKELGLAKYTFDYYQQYIGAGDDAMVAGMIRDYGDEKVVAQFMERSKALVHPLVKQGELKIKPGFHELVSYLKAKQTKIYLASSNFISEINFFLENTGLSGTFDGIISADDVAKAKPAPDIFLAAWEKAGCPPKEKCLVLEDSLNGIKAANNAQLPVAMVPDCIAPNDYARQNTVAIVADLAKIKNL
ncbi:HAD family hydrolase [Ligilactobacillus agilis]|uniref:HAD family hydrolase n=1 Tax=Ligilactobacillus agilis TaxID=1601 RepID=UPI003209CE28